MHCDRLLGLCRRYQVQVPLYVMTSPATDQATRLYFQQQRGCGLAQGQMQIFCQGSMPAVDSTSGLVLLESPGSLALSPDGHGGMVAALKRNGCLDDMQRRGIQFIYYAQIDNPMARACDPELVGYHLLSGSQMTTQVVKKRFAREKVGNVVAIDGRVQIIEYSDLPDEIADQVDSQGLPRFWAGNIAIHVFDLDFLQQAVQSSTALPFHRAQKKVSCIDSQGRLVHPDQPNATKFERFIFDLLPIARRAIAVEQSAAEVFAPVKNANGAAVDTPFHTQQAILNQHRRWIEAAGSTIQTGVSVEISPLWALDAQEVSQRLDRSVHFSRDTFLV
jgi:UDP-N-acetylglucosamine/UDP-N-acetylgalactosamine diphosphorylase